MIQYSEETERRFQALIRWIKQYFYRELVRPLVYTVFTRGILALLAAQLIHYFAPPSWPLAMFSNAALALGILFLLGAVLAWFRADGLKIPQLKLPRFKRKDPAFMAGDIADHIDDEITRFDDLDAEEQNVCVLLADLILAVVCLALAAVV